jgi:flagellar basal body-associated protein FliL
MKNGIMISIVATAAMLLLAAGMLKMMAWIINRDLSKQDREQKKKEEKTKREIYVPKYSELKK